jgi:hypothetical protein
MLGNDVRDWKVEWAQKDILNNSIIEGHIDKNMIIPVEYRPFDVRYMLFTGVSKTMLSAEDIEHYKKIIAALKHTEELMTEIDQVIEF